MRRSARLDFGQLIAAVENAPPVAAVDVVGAQLSQAVAAKRVSFLIADFSGQALIRLGHAAHPTTVRTQGRETAERVDLTGSPQGRALATQAVQIEDGTSHTRVCAPVTNRGEAIGVLEVCLLGAPDEQTVADIALAAHALAYVVIANRRFTDLFVWGQRSVPLSLAAEIQHRLLPGAYTCEGGQFTLAAWLEPAGNVGGDTFDFALERDTLHLSMTDAMGHEVDAAVLATVLVGGLRNARRAGLGLTEQASRANTQLATFSDHGGFVTGQLARVDLGSQTATIVNAGHPPPFRLRDGRVERLRLAADPPFGILAGYDYQVQTLPLQAGDRILFVTDGMLERNAETVDIAAVLEATRAMHPREAVRQLSETLLQATGGTLGDDATTLCFDWHGGASQQRTTSSGADS
ncbi:serine/threonine-protein phosphatase [Solirubrobacter sp. CPCC 204708]|nr:serine/threonine-protein phosphatase [Solirubrobacter deserti]